MRVDYDKDQLSYALANALKERDEAREEINNIHNILSKNGEAIGNGDYSYSIIEMVENLLKSKDFFIRKNNSLQSERDAAIEHWEEVREYGTDEINASVDLRQKLAQALVELDNMQDQRDLAMKVISRLERERDEAREERDKMQTELEMWRDGNIMHQIHRDELEKKERERDEAVADRKNSRQSLAFALEELDKMRAALMKIEDLFVDGTDVYADREKMGMIARNALEGAK